ncbi:MAG: hypothetical protein CSA84_02200 [Actinomycetales bacterium]|nr:MAG: hypothetical protein CSA84_02200 [Actinomycetales bacterium]
MTHTTPRPAATPGAPFAMILRGALVPSAIAGAVAALGLVIWRGTGSIAGVLVGLVVGLGFFASGLGLLSKLVRDRSPITFMAVAMSIYLAQVIALLLFLIAFREAGWLDGLAFGLVVLVITITWQVFLVRTWRTARVYVYDTTGSEHE